MSQNLTSIARPTRGAPGYRRAVLGVTLIELMITVAVVGILAAIAIPSYNGYIQRARRADAQSFLQDIAARETQFLSDRRAYATSITDAVADGGMALAIPANVSTYYTVVLAANNTAPPSFTVTATPTTRQASDTCGTLSINSNNVKTNSTGSKCW